MKKIAIYIRVGTAAQLEKKEHAEKCISKTVKQTIDKSSIKPAREKS